MALAPTISGDLTPGEVPEAGVVPGTSPSTQPWPAPGRAWWAVVVFALGLMLSQLDRSIFSMVIEMVKHDFHLTDLQVGLLLGPAGILFYVFVGIPVARLVDIYPRNIVLSLSLLGWSLTTGLCGIAQSYGQLFLCRTISGVGGSANAPGTYSMLADYFPPKKLPRAIAGLQVGFILGMGGASILGGWMIGHVSGWQPAHVGPLTIRNWQWVMIWVALPGLIVAALTRALQEPARRGRGGESRVLPFRAVLREVVDRRRVYGPLMLGLGLAQVEVQGVLEWRVPFFQRTYGWTPAQVGAWAGIVTFITFPLGLLVGTALTEWLGKRHRDAPLRATALVFLCAIPFSISGPLMPTPELSLVVTGIGGIFGFAGTVPQNAAIQTVTPNQMRGQITAMYLFMYTVFGALGSFFVALVTKYVVADEHKLWLSMSLSVSVLLPLAAIAIASGIRPYGREMERLEALAAREA